MILDGGDGGSSQNLGGSDVVIFEKLSLRPCHSFGRRTKPPPHLLQPVVQPVNQKQIKTPSPWSATQRKTAAVTQPPTCGDTQGEHGSAELLLASSHWPFLSPTQALCCLPQTPVCQAVKRKSKSSEAERHSCVFTATDSDPNRIPCQSLQGRLEANCVCVCARQESISGGDLQPFAIQSLPPTPQPPLRKDVLLEGALTLEVADGVVGFQPVPCHLSSQTAGTCPQAATQESHGLPSVR